MRHAARAAAVRRGRPMAMPATRLAPKDPALSATAGAATAGTAAANALTAKNGRR